VKRVYVCSPFRGDVAVNTAFALALCRAIVLRGDAPLAAHQLLPRALDDADPHERGLGVAAALAWLEVADELVVAGPVSEGMRAEIARASELGVPVRFHTEDYCS
jgi:hypothetical protein